MTQANDIVIVSGVRTAIGTFNGSLKHTHQHDLEQRSFAKRSTAPGLRRRISTKRSSATSGKSPKAALSPASASYGRGSRRRTLPIRLTASAAPDFRPWRTA
jgi:hypothetical protein